MCISERQERQTVVWRSLVFFLGVMMDEETIVESLAGEFVPLREKALRRDGTVGLRLIGPGWGSSGFYPVETLRRDGPQVFRAGTKMYWNHPTMNQESERPEGDLRDLAAVLVSDAKWEESGAAGPGLYADAKVFSGYAGALEELAPHIGVSIRASGRASTGEADGRKGMIINALTTGRSVDFVTEPGAGGRVVEMFEAARGSGGAGERKSERAEDEQASGNNALLSVGESTPKSGGGNVDELEKVQGELVTAQGRIQSLETERDRLAEALLVRDAQGIVREALGQVTLPGVTVARLQRSAATNPPVTAEGKLDEAGLRQRVAEMVAAETQYLQEAAGWGQGRIEGMGGGQAAGGAVDMAVVEKRLNSAFADLGYAVAGKGE